MTLPLVSIVVPAYNHARYTREAIDSLLSQDYPNVELIVIDDGSTDETRAILESYGDRFFRVSRENRGQSATLNEGWSRARGAILGYLSADDILYPRCVSRAVEELMRNPDVLVTYCDYDLVSAESRVARHVVAPDFTYDELITKFVTAIGPGSFFRREAFEKTGGWDPAFRQSPDHDFWLNVGLHGGFHHIRENHAGFRIHDGSTSFSQANEERSEEAVAIIEKFFRRSDLPPKLRALRDRGMGCAHVVAARAHLRSRRFGRGLRSLLRAWSYSPRAVIGPRGLRFIAAALLGRTYYLFRLKLLKRRTT